MMQIAIIFAPNQAAENKSKTNPKAMPYTIPILKSYTTEIKTKNAIIKFALENIPGRFGTIAICTNIIIKNINEFFKNLMTFIKYNAFNYINNRNFI